MESRRTLFPPLILRTVAATPASTAASPSGPLEVGRPTTPTGAQFVNEGWAIALVALTSVRLLVLLCLWIYLTHRTLRMRVGLHRVWLSQLLLASLALSHAVLYAFVVQPGPVSCTMVRFGVGLAYVLPFAILMLKLILIAAINKGYDIPKFCQVLLLSSFIGIQVALSAQWLALVPTTDALQNRPPGVRTCGVGIFSWLQHLAYAMLLVMAGTVVSIGTHHIKSNHREAMFVGFAFGFNIPVWIIWATTAALLKDRPAMEDKCLAFGMLASTTLIMFVMFLPRSRQQVAVGEGGLYTEDVPVVKPISELTVHKLYYPVYPERRSSAGGGTLRTITGDYPERRSSAGGGSLRTITGDVTSDVFNHEEASMATIPRLSSHWYPPLRDTLHPTNRSRPRPGASYSSRLAQSYQNAGPSTSTVHFEDDSSIRQGRLNGHGPQSSEQRRCLTPPSEEGSTTPSVQESERASGNDEDDSDVDMAHFRERNVDGVSYTQVSRQQLMY